MKAGLSGKAKQDYRRWRAGEFARFSEGLGDRCLMCGSDKETPVRTLVRPRTFGGADERDNWQPLCVICSLAKGDLWIDFREDPPIWRGHYGDGWRHWTKMDTARLFNSRRAKARAKARIPAGSPWKLILEAVGYRCLNCGSTDRPLTRDHILPRFMGGPSATWNLQPLCAECNQAKGKATVDLRPVELVDLQTKQWKCLVEANG